MYNIFFVNELLEFNSLFIYIKFIFLNNGVKYLFFQLKKDCFILSFVIDINSILTNYIKYDYFD